MILLDNKYEIEFVLTIPKAKEVNILIGLSAKLVWDLGHGIHDQIMANFEGYIDDEIYIT